MRVLSLCALLLALGSAVGCSGDDDDSAGNAGSNGNAAGQTSSGANGNAAGDTGSSGDRCQRGCVDTLAAKCPISPKDQATCESDCHALEAGACANEYATFQDCAEGKSITCDAKLGYPIVAGCEAQQGAFIACNQSQ